MFTKGEVLSIVIGLCGQRKSGDNKVYINNKEAMLKLLEIGGKLIHNKQDCAGTWVTEIRFCDNIFIHGSREPIIETKVIK